MRRVRLLQACVLATAAAIGSAAMADIIVDGFGANGWRSSDTRNASGTTLLGSSDSHPGLGPPANYSAANDAAIASQIKFAAEGSSPSGTGIPSTMTGSNLGNGAVQFYATTSNSGKANLTRRNTTTGFGPSTDLVAPGFFFNYRQFTIQDPTFRTPGANISVLGNNSSTYIFVYVDPAHTTSGVWTTSNVNGTSTFTLFGPGAPGGGGPSKTLSAWQADGTWGPILFGGSAKITEVGFTLGSSQRNAYTYLDWVETSILDGGVRNDFAFTPPAIRMTSPSTTTCNNTTTLTVNVDSVGVTGVAGGQFFVGWDASRLSLSTVTPGAGLQLFYNQPNGGGRDIGVGVNFGGPNIGSQTMATLTFSVSGSEACNLASLVYFRTGTPIPSRLTDDQGNDLGAALANLGGVSLDSVAPVIPPLSTLSFNTDLGFCRARESLSVTASDICTGAVAATATISGNPISFPYDFTPGTTTVTWSATDNCGNTSSATQNVVVTDNEAPSISCPPDVTTNVDAGQCTASSVSILGPNWVAFGDSSITTRPMSSDTVGQLASAGGPFGYAGIVWTPSSPLLFNQLTTLSTDYAMVSGCFGAGSPRFQISLDTNNDGIVDGRVFVYLGSYPNFNDCPTPGVWANTGNLITSPDLRWDSTQLGGPFYGNHAGTVAALGTAHVIRISLVLDGGSQVIDVDNITVNSAVQTFNTPGPSDNCGVASVTGTRDDLQPLSAPYHIGTTTITWTVTDIHSNQTSCDQHITVLPQAGFSIAVDETGLSSAVTRCVTADFWDGCTIINSVPVSLSFNASGHATGTAVVPVTCAHPNYTSVTLRDPKHSLRRTGVSPTNFGIDDDHTFYLDFTGSKALEEGNLNDDTYVDILDAGIFLGQFGSSPGGSTPCGFVPHHSDFSGDGTVFTEDFTFIQAAFLHFRDLDPCGAPLVGEGPVTDISVDEAMARNLPEVAKLDMNLDGRVNGSDIAWIAVNGLPRCIADFNDDQATNVQDIFAYLNAWFMGHPRCDVNGNGRVEVQDIFDFINTWFQGC